MKEHEVVKWKRIAIELANHQASTAESLSDLKSTSRTEKDRQKRICNRIINLLRGDALPHAKFGFEAVIKKLAQAIKE